MRARFVSLALVALAAVACASRTEVASPPPAASRAVAGAASATAPAGAPATSAGAQCRLSLSVGPVQVRPGCTIDQRVGGRTAELVYPCDGGAARVTFGDTTFVGHVANGEVDVSTETTFPFSDGCRWRTKQRIAGALGGGPLQYTYEERPDPGQSGCAAGCDATAIVQAR
jgi:hypothetical protein